MVLLVFDDTKLNIAGSTNSLPANVSVQLLVEALHVGVEV